jgi:D-glycero-D-manno-heptose 1,7-bisphosphate phosphatase
MDKVPAIFLDRDGVIIENRPSYIRSLDDVAFIPGALDALVRLSRAQCKIVIVTNQSAIGRGLITQQEGYEINRFVIKRIEQAGGRVDATFICPHRPDQVCHCRKPKPGLLHEAAKALRIDLASSAIVGDALSDLQAGQAAGLSRLYLVRTGRGEMQLKLPEMDELMPFRVSDDLLGISEELAET